MFLWAAALYSQTWESVEFCGIAFRIGMTIEEVRSKLALPPMPPERRREIINLVAGKNPDIILINPVLFSLPLISPECYGSLMVRANRVVSIRKGLSHPRDAMTLVRVLVNRLNNLRQETGLVGLVNTYQVRSDDEESLQYTANGMSIWFGERGIDVRIEEFHIDQVIAETLGMGRKGGAVVISSIVGLPR